MRNASMHQLKIATVLLCAISGATTSSVWAQQAAPAPVAKPAAAAPAKGFTPPASSSGQSIDSIAVVVNDDVITRNEVAARIKSVEQRMKAQNVPLPDPADLRRQLLERMIVERAQMQLAKEMGVRVDDLTLDRAIGRIAEQQKMTVQELRNQMEKKARRLRPSAKKSAMKSSCSACASMKSTPRSRFPIPKWITSWQRKKRRPANRSS